MVVVDGLHGEAAAAGADALLSGGGGGCDLQAFFEQAGLEVAAAVGGEAEPGEEEELEWLSNKDAFPAVETMAPKPPVVGPRTKGARRRRRAVAWSPPPALPPRPPAAPAAAPAGPRWCRHCGTTKTPQWREGPEGRATLCNACGVRYRTGRLVPEYRPVNSPTFSPELHSNIHRRVVEMRLCRGLSAPAAAAVAGDK